MFDVFVKIKVNENKDFESIKAGLSELNCDYHIGIPELNLDVDTPKTQIVQSIYIRYSFGGVDEALFEFLKENKEKLQHISAVKYKTVYGITYADVDESNVTALALKFDYDDVLYELGTLREARKTFEIIESVYTGQRIVVLTKQLYEVYEDGSTDDSPFGYEVIDTIEN